MYTYIYAYIYACIHVTQCIHTHNTHQGVAKGDVAHELSRRVIAGTLGVFYLGVAEGDEIQEQGHGAELGGALADVEGLLLELHHVPHHARCVCSCGVGCHLVLKQAL